MRAGCIRRVLSIYRGEAWEETEEVEEDNISTVGHRSNRPGWRIKTREGEVSRRCILKA
jgi:hypothetical protein